MAKAVIPSGRKRKLRRRKIGAIWIILCAALPLLLLLFRYGIDLMNYYRAKIYGSGSVTLYKSRAHEAALAVAKKWNPGLTLNQQKISLLRIADDIYNTSTTNRIAPVHAAIPGLEVYTVHTVAGGIFDPYRWVWFGAGFEGEPNIPMTEDVIPYETVDTMHTRRVFTFGGAQAFYRIMYGSTKDPRFLLKRELGNWISEDMFWDYIPGIGHGYRAAALTARTEVFDGGPYNTAWGDGYGATEQATYTIRTASATDDPRVQITVASDKIAVQADSDVAFAVPAECNVDIVLAIPINGAATNANNCDSTTPTIGASHITLLPHNDKWYSTTINGAELEASEFVAKSIRKTPIYQIAQELKTFLRNNFEFTRGVNVGLIPYSGKLSLPPDRNYEWTVDISPFDATKFLTDQNACLAYLRGCFLYSVNGAQAGTNLIPPTNSPQNPYVDNSFRPQTSSLSIPASYNLSSYVALWGALNEQTIYSRSEGPGTGVMCRCGDGANSDYIGDPLSTEAPTQRKWRRVNMYPCYLGYANLLSMKTNEGLLYPHPYHGAGWPQGHTQNPYFLIELQSDVGKICDLLSVMGPFSERAVSNFLFIPVSWAHNLFCDWTNDPGCGPVDTADDSETGGRLLHQGKFIVADRKKALILIINKPDWFEPHELTYLGFDNDYSEIPMVESDRIRFDVASGSQLITGLKQILKFSISDGNFGYNATSGYYETSTINAPVSARLSFPQKYLLKMVAEPVKQQQELKWESVSESSSLHAFMNSGWEAITSIGSTLVALNCDGSVATSTDCGATWTPKTNLTSNSDWSAITAIGSTLVALNYDGSVAANTDDGATWVDKGSISISESGWRSITTVDNTLVALNDNGSVAVSADGGATWVNKGSISGIGSNWFAIIFTGSALIALNENGTAVASIDGGDTWSEVNDTSNAALESTDWKAITLNNEKLVLLRKHGNIMISDCINGSITIDDASHKLVHRQEFYIESGSIAKQNTDSSYYVDLELRNSRLIFAEITNRPYSVENGVYTYTALRLPEMSRVVDFSKKTGDNKFVYNIGDLKLDAGNDYISCGSSADEPGTMGIRWNAIIDRWELYRNAGDHSDGNYLRSGTFWGDFFMMTDLEVTHNILLYHKILSSPNDINDYFGTGLNRSFWPFLSHRNMEVVGECGYRWKTYNTDMPLIFAGLTLPINATLYHGFGSTRVGEGGWYFDGNNQMDYDATRACQRLTVAACAKLKEAYGNNLRIYVVKYRKQSQFKHKITGANVDFDYSYIDECATNKDYVYDANELDIKNYLQDIANDIKVWATYTPAKLCD
ncbi:MAG: glycoside hydrolase [Holosporaceae bacterium]|jgi:hypothetical protein|nr:glycoside hydrolase [Holosporaceae bacterium]